MTQPIESPAPSAAPSVRSETRKPDVSGSEPPIAIVGMACRFPGADAIPAFWRLLDDGVNAVQEGEPGSGVGRIGELFPNREVQSVACRFGAYLDRLDQFDAAFFRISPVEAQLLDPQQRLMLETCWRALEDAGMDPERLRGSRKARAQQHADDRNHDGAHRARHVEPGAAQRCHGRRDHGREHPREENRANNPSNWVTGNVSRCSVRARLTGRGLAPRCLRGGVEGPGTCGCAAEGVRSPGLGERGIGAAIEAPRRHPRASRYHPDPVDRSRSR